MIAAIDALPRQPRQNKNFPLFSSNHCFSSNEDNLYSTRDCKNVIMSQMPFFYSDFFSIIYCNLKL